MWRLSVCLRAGSSPCIRRRLRPRSRQSAAARIRLPVSDWVRFARAFFRFSGRSVSVVALSLHSARWFYAFGGPLYYARAVGDDFTTRAVIGGEACWGARCGWGAYAWFADELVRPGRTLRIVVFLLAARGRTAALECVRGYGRESFHICFERSGRFLRFN